MLISSPIRGDPRYKDGSLRRVHTNRRPDALLLVPLESAPTVNRSQSQCVIYPPLSPNPGFKATETVVSRLNKGVIEPVVYVGTR